jgi:hypothetical protein
METKDNKILKKCKNTMDAMLDHLKRIMVEYKPFLAIMQTNQNSIQMAKVNEMPHVQTILYDFQISKTCELFLFNLIKSSY